MREIILDTETTGFDPKRGDRLIEIGCVEIVNRFPTGREWHVFVNPERDVPADAEKIHGISTAFLKDKPLFAKVVDDFLKFVGGDPLVIHNAQFDIGFLNAELERIGRPGLSNAVTDTVALARRKFPGAPASLDALCKRFGIDNSKRTKHGALIDCLLLAEVYVELLGERQAALGLQNRAAAATGANAARGNISKAGQRPQKLKPRIDAASVEQHKSFIAELGAKAVWLKHWPQG